MLAKVISYAPTRARAAAVLADALARTRLHGVRTNRDLLVNVPPSVVLGCDGYRILRHPRPDPAGRATGRRAGGAPRPSPPRSRRRRPQPRDRRRCSRSAPADGATSYRATSNWLFRARAAPSTRWPTGSPGRVHLPDDPGVDLASAAPDEVVRSADAVATVSRSPATARRIGWTPLFLAGRVARPAPLPGARFGGRTKVSAGADARFGD